LPPFEFIEFSCSCSRKQKVQSQRASQILGRVPAFGADLETNGSKKKVTGFSTVIYFPI